MKTISLVLKILENWVVLLQKNNICFRFMVHFL